MNSNQAVVKSNMFEHKATLNLFSWRIQIFEKKTKRQVIDNVDMACIDFERKLNKSFVFEQQRVLDSLK
jgi:hypothetical protein